MQKNKFGHTLIVQNSAKSNVVYDKVTRCVITSKKVSCFTASSQNSFRNHHFYSMYPIQYPTHIKESKNREKFKFLVHFFGGQKQLKTYLL